MWYYFLLPFVFSSLFILHFSQSPVQFMLFLTGVVFGFSFLLLDRLLHAFYVEPDTEFSKRIQSAGKNKQYRDLFTLIFRDSTLEQAHLISRSTVFMVCYMAITIYVVTSSTNVLGVGLVLGIGLRYCLDLLVYRVHVELLTEQFLWQIKHVFKQTEVNFLIGGFFFYFMTLTFLVLR